MRNNSFLEQKLRIFLDGPFSDMETPNALKIHFGRRARRRFGSIKMSRDKQVTIITINGLFRDESIPEQIIHATIAHELCHYAHGFSSPLPKKYKYPHQGGVIAKEMQVRGLQDLFIFEKAWTKQNWRRVLQVEFPQQKRRALRRPLRRPKSKKMSLKLILNYLKPGLII